MSTPRPLTGWQATLLFIVDQNAPVSVADVAYHSLADASTVRSRLNTLEARGLITRTYTGHDRGSQFAFVMTEEGETALEAATVPEDPTECDLCGMTEGKHLRACILNPDRPPRPRKTT